jgi:3',5'-cyclic AMP phosphodiesterase CpdA
MSRPFRLAHMTDPHFRSFAGLRLVDLASKRGIGALNVFINRRRFHKMELLDALAVDLANEKPDHLTVSGDLSNVSLKSEWRGALTWLRGLTSPPEDVTVIPGNHDAYVASVVESGVFEELFHAYQTVRPQSGERAGAIRHGYPFVRFRGPIALLAVNSCVATRDLGAWGEIGQPQLDAIAAMLGSPEVRARRRVVMLHHPPVKLKGGENRNLKDREEFAAMLERAGADLVIHGHDHRDELAVLRGPARQSIPVVGAGSASYAGSPTRRARYNIYEFDGAQITVTTRAHDESTGTFREVRRHLL